MSWFFSYLSGLLRIESLNIEVPRTQSLDTLSLWSPISPWQSHQSYSLTTIHILTTPKCTPPVQMPPQTPDLHIHLWLNVSNWLCSWYLQLHMSKTGKLQKILSNQCPPAVFSTSVKGTLPEIQRFLFRANVLELSLILLCLSDHTSDQQWILLALPSKYVQNAVIFYPPRLSLSDSSRFSLGLSQEFPYLVSWFQPFPSIFYSTHRTRVWSISNSDQVTSLLKSLPGLLITLREKAKVPILAWKAVHSLTLLWSSGLISFLPPSLSPSQPYPHLSVLWIHKALSCLQALLLLFPLPGKLFPQVPTWLTLWVPWGVCSKATVLVICCLALACCLSSCDILLGVDTPWVVFPRLPCLVPLAGWVQPLRSRRGMWPDKGADLSPPLCLPQAVS